MTIITNYSTLQSTIADYAHRSDLSNQIPGFIQLAEERINSDLRAPEMQATATITPTGDLTPLPARFKGMRSVTGTYGANTYTLLPVSPDAVTKGAVVGEPPQLYALLGTSIEIPGGEGSTFTLDYWAAPEPLATANTSAVLSAYPSLYLYAALIEVGAYLQDGEYKIEATNTYAACLAKANLAADRDRYGAAPQMRVA